MAIIGARPDPAKCTAFSPQTAVQLQRPDVPDWSRRVGLDQIVRVEHPDSIMGSES